MSRFRCMFVVFVVMCGGSLCLGGEMLLLSGGTVVADRQDLCTGDDVWFGESVTTLTIDAVNIGEGEYVEISGMITGITDIENCSVEIGLIPKERWDYWQTAYEGDYKAAVFNKGLYVVDWFSHAQVLGLSLQEGWNVGGATITTLDGPFAWPLSRPNKGNPWEFAISMFPDDSGGGEASLWFNSGRVYSEEPFYYGGQTGNNNDYSECYLIAQIWSFVPDAEFSFKHVRARVMKNKSAVE